MRRRPRRRRPACLQQRLHWRLSQLLRHLLLLRRRLEMGARHGTCPLLAYALAERRWRLRRP